MFLNIFKFFSLKIQKIIRASAEKIPKKPNQKKQKNNKKLQTT